MSPKSIEETHSWLKHLLKKSQRENARNILKIMWRKSNEKIAYRPNEKFPNWASIIAVWRFTAYKWHSRASAETSNTDPATARTYKETCRKLINKVMYCLEMKKLPKVYESISGIHQQCSFYGERAKDLERELERNTSSAKDGLCPMRKKLNKVGWLPCRLRGKLNELRKEAGHSRQKLAKKRV